MSVRNAWSRVTIATLVAVGGMLALGWIGFTLYLAEPPLPPRPAAGPAQVSPPLARRQVIFLVDSLREDAANDPEVMPNFVALGGKGRHGVNITPPMTLTTMSVVTLGTGITPSVSWSVKNFDAEPFEDESVFSLLAEAGHTIALLGDASWTQLYGDAAEHTLAFRDKGFYRETRHYLPQSDWDTLERAATILADPRYTMVVIHVTGSDKAAHRYGAHLREEDGSLSPYARALRAIDAELGKLYARYGDGATWLALSDHGCSKQGNHGGGEEEARRAPFAWAGPGIRAGAEPVQQPMTRIAATLTALAGVRAPRVAEQPANLALLTHEPAAGAALVMAHASERAGFAQGYLHMAGLGYEPPAVLGEARQRLEGGDPAAAAVLAGRSVSELTAMCRATSRDRDWLRLAGLGLGALLQFLLFFGIAHAAGMRRPWIPAVAWIALSWVALTFAGWQFRVVDFLGNLVASAATFAVRSAILLGLAGATWLGVRWARRIESLDGRVAAWLLFGFVVLVLGQSVMTWPYGPLAEMYRAMVLLGLGWWAIHHHLRKVPALRRVLVAGGLLAGLWILSGVLLAGHDEHRVVDTTLSSVLANAAYAIVLLWLAAGALRPRSDRRVQLLWAGLGALAVLASVYRLLGTPWMVQVILVGLVVPLAAMRRLRLQPRQTRAALMAVACVLFRTLSLDWRVVLLLLLVVIALVVSEVRTRRHGVAVPLGVTLLLLTQHSFFYEIGYAFSFTSIDVNVAFAATRDAIDLGEGFVLILLSHLAPWLVLVSAFAYNRLANGDPRGLGTGILALVGAFLIQGWGVFVSFEGRIDNHWFTMHALPLFVFAMCNALLVGLACAGTTTLLPLRPRTGPQET